MESKKFNFVYEKTTEEDRKFIESFQIEKEYHSGMVDVMYWACDKEKGMYFILNDASLGLVLEGVNGPRVANFIYKNIVNTIKYNYHSDRFVHSIEYKEFRVDKKLKDEEEYVVEAMRKALEVFWGSFFNDRKMKALN
ncbi:hypothetical protein H8S00_10520 [Eubacterium sp. BX4]|uniref:Immunity protein 63 domain-containing protein n=2 Tax=Eubacterium TaxID=1730 RepID=A0ABR7F639_9FIRM|nr:hypothetical protein [Eubacterium segne]MBC5668419.1 hypothetical protein [Eubacterium segne]RHR70414.1 hypothetical protein DWW68_10325 [Eubacterium sp. AF16-48]